MPMCYPPFIGGTLGTFNVRCNIYDNSNVAHLQVYDGEFEAENLRVRSFSEAGLDAASPPNIFSHDKPLREEGEVEKTYHMEAGNPKATKLKKPII